MKKTPLYDEHIELKARMVEFGGWDMPVFYSGVIDEHLAVRNAAGIFDVSHMGEFEFTGPKALACVQYLTSNDVEKLADGQAQYSLLCNERGTLVDDIIVYRFNADHLLMVVNASNIEKDWAWVNSHKKVNTTIKNRSDDFALIALQGPKAASILRQLTSVDLDLLKSFNFTIGSVAGAENVIIARTGYTGEDGFEIFCPPSGAPKIWNALYDTGGPVGLKPVGLGARDTLRLEMKYSLYGHEINDTTNPLEAGLGWVVRLNKGSDFIGHDALEKIKAEGLKRKCIGFQMIDEGIPRQGYGIHPAEVKPSHHRTIALSHQIGTVTSGTMSPSLSKAIGIGYVPMEKSEIGSKIFIDIRGHKRLAEVTSTPFYKKG